jgi:tetrahydromethanopterin S-methyltransferase subunit G
MLSFIANVQAQREIKEIEKRRNAKRHALFQAQDVIDERKDQLLCEIEQRFGQKITQEVLFMIRWRIV